MQHFFFKINIILVQQINFLNQYSMKFTSELSLFLKARYPIIYINTIEED